MANKKITELDAVTTLASTDVVPVVDVSADTTNKITAANLFRTLPDGTAAAPALAFSSDAANGVYLAGTDTVGISTGGTQRVTVDGSGNVTISGDLTVSGATTTVESTTVTIDDKNLELGSVATPTDSTADGGGITLKGATDHTIIWTNSTDSWDFSEHVSIASGKEFRIAGTKVLDATSLGSAVVSSSLTSVGTLTGLTVSGNVDLGDNNELLLGTGDDLKLFHDGTNSEINNETGNLLIANKANDADVVIQSDNGSGGITTYVRCDGSNGEVRLYHYGTEKLNTKSDGVDITGELQVSSGTTDVVADFASSDANAWIQIRDNSTTDTAVMVGAVGDDLRFRAGSNEAARITSAGRLGIGTSAPASLLNISASSGGDTSGLRITRTDSGGGDWRIWSSATANGEGAGKLIFGNSGNRVVIDGSGNVGVGTTSPQSKLDLGSDTGVKITLLQSNYSLGVESNELRIASNQSTTFYSGGHSGTERLRLDSSGRLLLGTTTEGSSSADDLTVATSAETGITIRSGTSSNGNIFFSDGTSGDSEYRGFITYAHDGDSLRFATTNSERFRIDSSGHIKHTGLRSGNGENKLANYTVPSHDTSEEDVCVFSVANESSSNQITFGGGGSAYNAATAILFRTASAVDTTTGTERMRLDSSGRLLLGTTTEGEAGADNLTIADSGNCGMTIRSGSSSGGGIYFSDATSGTGEYDGLIAYSHSDRYMQFYTAATERFRITSTGAWSIEGASNYGTSGQVLTSNGNDAPTWQDAGSASVGGATAISMNDSVNINFGADNDLQIYHNGSHSYIDNENNDLLIRNTANDQDIVLMSDNSSGGITQYLRCDGSAGAVRLYSYGSEKLTTFSSGVDITGELQCDSLDVDGAANFNGADVDFVGSSYTAFWDYSQSSFRFQDDAKAKFGTGEDMEIYHNGSQNLITSAGQVLEVRASTFLVTNSGGNENLLKAISDGACELYQNGSKKLSTTSSGVDVTGSFECDSLGAGSSLQQSSVASFKGSTNNQVNICDSTNGSWGLLLTQSQGDSVASGYHYSTNSSVNKPCAVVNVNNDALHFATNNAARFRIDHDGHVLPTSNNSYDLGSSSLRWRNVYTNDLNLSNEGSTNDVDGTWGNYTIQEGEDDLFLINRRNGKKYKFNLTEVS